VEDNALMVRVTDTGVGIAPEALTNLFTEFYQVAPSSAAAGGAATAQSTDAREGTGLGLALTKKFVELHGGTVEVASEVGKGSTFTLRFPAVNGSGAEQAVAS
jgi:signal transduction histidine kinase